VTRRSARWGDMDLLGRVTVAAAVGAALVAACGGSGGSPSPSGAPDGGPARDVAEPLLDTQPDTTAIFGLAERPANPTCRLPEPTGRPAELLSQTGCLDPRDPREPATGLIPYDVASPLWSDGARKRRFFALPDGAQIQVKDCRSQPQQCAAAGGTPEDDGHWTFPVGTVLVKSFEIGGHMVETRLLMRVNEFTWRGYSYEWNDAQTDASLLPDEVGGKTKVLSQAGGDQTWHFPARDQCLQCHTQAAGISLGLSTPQLNRDFRYPSGVTSNQLDTLEHIALFARPLERLDALPSPAAADGAQERARSYLHANCANCHRPQGSFEGIDLRYQTPLAGTGLCNQPPEKGDLGVAGALRLVPGMPDRSLLSLRMHTTEMGRMPQIGTTVVDGLAVQLIDDWIRAMTSCP
jgi:uncharacterized repeat protein (TIGR03806 family)